MGSICRQFLLWDSLPGSTCGDVFVFSVRRNETRAGCALSALPFPSLFCVKSLSQSFNFEQSKKLVLGAAFCRDSRGCILMSLKNTSSCIWSAKMHEGLKYHNPSLACCTPCIAAPAGPSISEFLCSPGGGCTSVALTAAGLWWGHACALSTGLPWQPALWRWPLAVCLLSLLCWIIDERLAWGEGDGMECCAF